MLGTGNGTGARDAAGAHSIDIGGVTNSCAQHSERSTRPRYKLIESRLPSAVLSCEVAAGPALSERNRSALNHLIAESCGGMRSAMSNRVTDEGHLSKGASMTPI